MVRRRCKGQSHSAGRIRNWFCGGHDHSLWLSVVFTLCLILTAQAQNSNPPGGSAAIGAVNQAGAPWTVVLNPSAASSAGIVPIAAYAASSSILKAAAGNFYSASGSVGATPVY